MLKETLGVNALDKMMYVLWGGIVGIKSSGTKKRQKAGKWLNGDYLNW